MSNSENVTDDSWLNEALAELRGDMHIPTEIMMADARGVLSAEGHRIVASHVGDCDVCQRAMQMAKDALDGPVYSSEASESVPEMPDSLAAKAKLVARLNQKRDEIVGSIAKLLLPEEVWFAIKPAISISRRWEKNSAIQTEGDTGRPMAAAFGSGSSKESEQCIQTVLGVVVFFDSVSDLILEQADNLSDAKSKMGDCVARTAIEHDPFSGNPRTEEQVVRIITGSLSEDGE